MKARCSQLLPLPIVFRVASVEETPQTAVSRQKQTVLSSSSRAQKNQTQSSGAGSPVIARMAFALDSGLAVNGPAEASPTPFKCLSSQRRRRKSIHNRQAAEAQAHIVWPPSA